MRDWRVTCNGNGVDEVLALLATASAHGLPGTRVERIDTHISAVFLAGDRAYKLKRPVRLPYLDYSTLEARRTFCEKEVRLNRRTAPDLYRGIVPVTRAADGALRINGDGEPVEWLVEMRRFDQDQLLDAVARRGALDETIAAAIGDAAARLHLVAAARTDHGGAAVMRWVIDDNDAELSAAGAIINQAAREQLHVGASGTLDRVGGLLDARRAGGWVRECHGDLHLGNIFLDNGRPVLFDGIEFNDDLSCIDVLYDLAFVVMDLLHRGLPAQANATLNAWLERLPQYEALPLLPLYLSCRAAIRAKVLMTAAATSSDHARQQRAEAGTYLDRALALIAPGTGAILAVGGLPGSGKSSVARRLAPRLGRPPGAVILRSDVTRKRRFGMEPTVRLPDSAYDPATSLAVYDEITRSACDAARGGSVAIVDAVLGSASQRRALRDAAAREGLPFAGLWLEAPSAMMEARLAGRIRDASDATVDVLRRQQQRVTVPDDWARIDAGASLDQVVDRALASCQRETLAGLIRA